MKMVKNAIIVSLIITVPVFFLIPAILWFYTSVFNKFIDSEMLSMLLRVLMIIIIVYFTIKIYKRFILRKYKIIENGTIGIILRYVIPAIVIGNFFGAYIVLIPKIEYMLKININEYSDFFSKIEKNLPLMMSFALYVLWGSNESGSSRDANSGNSGD